MKTVLARIKNFRAWLFADRKKYIFDMTYKVYTVYTS